MYYIYRMLRLDRNNTNFTTQLFEALKNDQWGPEYRFLKYYQNIVRTFVGNIDVRARGLLVYLTMGLGKSILAMSIVLDLMDRYQPIVLLMKSLQENMRGAIIKCVRMRGAVDPGYRLAQLSEPELDKWISDHFSFVSMNASNMMKQMGKAAEGRGTEEFDKVMEAKMGEVLKLASLDGKLLVVDEAHNLFRAITNGSKNAIGLYDMVMRAKNMKIIFLTGTPISNDPFELVPAFNMLGGGDALFPETYREFNKLFVDSEHGKIKNKEKFQNRILGLVSHVSQHSEPGKALGIDDPATRAEFPEERPITVEYVNMDPEQYVMYQLARDKEKEEGSGRFGKAAEPAAMTKPKSKAASTYRVKSRQLSNYCPPPAARDEKDPTKLPRGSLAAAKFRRMAANIDKHAGQTGIVYSQFVGVGGLGSFAQFLESTGWERVEVGRATPTKSAPGEEGELDEYSGGIGGRSTEFAGNSAVPSADDMLAHIERIGGWAVGGEDDESSDEDESAEFTLQSAIEEPSHDSKITFRYITADECEKHGIDRKLIEYPNYTLLILQDGKPVGDAHVVFETGEHGCTGRLAAMNLKTGTPIPTAVLSKIIGDTVRCSENRAEFKKYVWGGAVDPEGARPANRPNRPRRFAVISGEVSVEDRARLQEMFNSPENIHGGTLDLLLLSSTGAEGLDLKNGRHVHIMEPYWNWGRIAQIIARLVRNDSHIALPAAEKNVQPYVYLAVPPETERLPDGTYPPTTDTELYNESLANHLVIESFYQALREVSIECMINGESYCRVCSPTDEKLFTDDILRDMRAPDPCRPVKEATVKAEEIEFEGEKYYYRPDSTSVYDYAVFYHDPRVNAYRPLAQSDPKYAKIAEAIVAKK